jgi:hypothetical protein
MSAGAESTDVGDPLVANLVASFADLVDAINTLSDRQESMLAELRAYTSTVAPWRESQIAFRDDESARGSEIIAALAQLAANDDYLIARARAHAEIVKRSRAEPATDAAALAAFRGTSEYQAAFTDAEPLVTVRIATYNRPQQLVDVAIASVLSQTYENWELVVVSDGPSAENRRAATSVKDRRIRYVEKERTAGLPRERRNSYLVSGAATMNAGTRLAAGSWLAPLDDDDAFSPDHIEKLLGLARAEGAELAYGALIQRNLVTGAQSLIWSDPPRFGGISLQGVLYLTGLRFMELDEESWLFDEAGDWHLIERMLAAGVTTANTRDVVGVLNTVHYLQKSDR